MPLHPQSIKDFPSLLEYLNEELDWDVDANDAQEYSFDWTPDELGLDAKYSVGIKEAKQIRTAEESLPVFWLEFENKRLPVVVLRRILRAFVKKKRASANSASRMTVEKMDDLLFICAVGEENNRGLTLAHFRPLEDHHLAQLRTFGWDGHETQFHYLQKHLNQLKWENRDDWSRAFIAEHGRAIKDSKELAIALAEFAREIRDYTKSLYEVEAQNGALHELHKNFGALLGSTTPAEFADAVAQTITSALLAVRFEGHTLENVALTEIQHKIPFTNPFLTEFIEHLARIGFNREQGVDFDDLGIEDLKAFLNAVNIEAIKEKFGSTSQGGAQDPVIHFYETFLAAYDSKERMKRGVYYTPKPVVDFIVRGVDHLLREELGFALGLADASQDENGNYNVTILDPATGTGTFLVSVVETIHATMCSEWKKQGRKPSEYSGLWNEYVSRDLLPRLFGFELMMAPYTVAHLKIGLKLTEFGYTPKRDERLNVFLTNTLEQSQQLALDLPGFLSKEASEAARVKNQTRVTVVVGNPPYAGHSANENDWVRSLLRSKLPDGADSIFKVDGADLGERNPKWLNDDYVKFTRYAQLRLAQSGRGVLGFITNHGYLDNPTFRGLRQSLLHTFPASWQLDLHGNSKKKEKTPDGKPDENVFEIQQGVSLNFGVKGGSTPGVHHADLWGTQNEKYEWCEKSKFENAAWQEVEAKKPNYLFVPQDGGVRDEYDFGEKATEIFPVNSLGMATARDAFCVQDTKDEMWKVVCDFAKLPAEKAREKFDLGKDARDWQVAFAQSDVKNSGPNKKYLAPILYRPFDNRWTYYTGNSRGFHCMPRNEVSKHIVGHENVGISTTRNIEIERGFEHVFISDSLIQLHTVSIKEVNYFFPLYLYNPPINWDTQLLGTGQNSRRANLAPGFVARLGGVLGLQWMSDGRGDGRSTLGPEDVLAYIYAIFHAPSYRSRYAEFLKIDFPRVPLTNDAALFWELVERGRELIGLHLLDEPRALATGSTLPHSEKPVAHASGSLEFPIEAGYPKYEDGQVLINKAGEGFDDVPEPVWNFHIGGYQVAHKWLKDRKGRVLTEEDAAHYRKVLLALERTIVAMKAIDEIITEHGNWPLPGSQEQSTLSDTEVKSFFGVRGAIEVASRPAKKPVKNRTQTTKDKTETKIKARAMRLKLGDSGFRIHRGSDWIINSDEGELVFDDAAQMNTMRRFFSSGALWHLEEANHELQESEYFSFPYTSFRSFDERINELLWEAQRRKIAWPTEDGFHMIIVTPSIEYYSRDELISVLKNIVSRKWITREDAIREGARVLGFARTGRNIQDHFKSAINGAIRRGVLEYDGDWIRRA